MIKIVKNLYIECKHTAMSRGNRKYVLLLICFSVLVFGLLLTGFLPLLAPQYTVFASSLVALYTVYCGGNVLSKQYEPEPPVTKAVQKVSSGEESE